MTRRRRISVAVAAVPAAGLLAFAGLGVEGLAGANSESNDVGGTTGIVSAGPAVTPATGTQQLSVPAAAFAPDGLHTTTNDYFNEWDPATLSNTDTSRCFNSGVNLPAGAKVSSVTFYYTEGSTSMFVDLNRQDLANHTYQDLAGADTPTTSTPNYTSTTIALLKHKTVVASDAYALGVCPNGNTTFSGAIIDYTG
jgi:hypothetical protein